MLEIKNLYYSYNSNLILENINCTIKKGEYIGIVGPNGGGKTTFIKLILNLLKPDKGQINLDGVPLWAIKKDRKIGYVPQGIASQHLDFPATVAEIIENNALINSNKQQIDKILDLVDLWDLKNRLIKDLSGGQRQKVFLARSLVNNPQLLILDEPTTGIDQKSQKSFYKMLTRLNKEQGLTILFVSHDTEILARQVSRMLCIQNTIVCFDDPHHVHEHFHK